MATIWRILSRRGFVIPQSQKRPRSSFVRFQAEMPNERWQADITHWTLTLGRRHLERVLRAYIGHYNEARPHRGLALRTPIGNQSPAVGELRAVNVGRRDVLGGLIHEYRAAA